MRTVVLAVLLLALAVPPAGADKCGGAKLKAMGKQEAGLLACQAKVAKKNDTSDLAACESNARTNFSTAFGKAGTCGGDEMTCETTADACESAIASALTDTFPSKCEAAKRTAAGKLARDELNCYSKAATTGVALDGTCISKATGKFATALGKAGACTDGGAPLTLVETKCVAPAVAANGGGIVSAVCPPCDACGPPRCGDGTITPPEQCDGEVFCSADCSIMFQECCEIASGPGTCSVSLGQSDYAPCSVFGSGAVTRYGRPSTGTTACQGFPFAQFTTDGPCGAVTSFPATSVCCDLLGLGVNCTEATVSDTEALSQFVSTCSFVSGGRIGFFASVGTCSPANHCIPTH
jgi:hypothetical protein